MSIKDWVPSVVIVAIVAGGILWWNRQDEGATTSVTPASIKADRDKHCQKLAGTPAERLDACLAELPSVEISSEAKAALTEIGKNGKFFSVAHFDWDTAPLQLKDHAPVRDALMGIDEQAASKALRDLDVRGFIVARDLTGALDRDNTVLARLAHHDFLEWFQLRYVTDQLFIYTVRSSPAKIPIDTGDALLRGLRARLEGKPAHRQRWAPEAVRLIATARLQGATLASRHVILGDDSPAAAGDKGNNRVVDAALDELAAKLRRDWERKVEIQGHGRLDDRLDDIRLEVHVVMERAPVEPRSQFAIFDLFEMGVDGMMFRQRAPKKGENLDEKFTYLPGSELVTRSLHSPDEFLRAAVRDFGWQDVRPWEKDPRTRLDIIRTQHFMESSPGGGPAIRLTRGMPEVPTEWVTDKNVQDMLVSGGEWWLANQFPDGSFEYKYWPEQNRRSEDYNEVRHILAARDLADTWRYRKDQRYLDGSRKSMDWLLQFEVDASSPPKGPLPHPPEGTMLFRYPRYEQQTAADPANQKLGTVAVGLLGWVAWAEASGSHAEDERIRKMAKFTLAMLEPDGRFRPYYVHSGHRYEKERNDIVPGEAMLALGMVAEYFKEPQWVEVYPKFQEFYQPWFRQRAERRVPTGRWPHDIYENQDRLDLVQFGPWSVMAAKQVYRLTGSKEAAEFGLEVADWMIDSYQWRGDRAPWPDYVGGYYKMPTELPAMQTFCYSEGTAAAYTLASRHAPERSKKYEQSTREAIRFLEVMQFDDLDSYAFPRPDKLRGGIKYTMNENKVRIDYVGHGLSTLSQWLDARAYDPAVTIDIWDPADLSRPAGRHNSVPGLDYSSVPLVYPSSEMPSRGVEDAELAPSPAGTVGPASRDARDREDDDEKGEGDG
jgi:hypothetical protein